MKALIALLLVCGASLQAQVIALFTTNISVTATQSIQYVRTRVDGSLCYFVGTNRVTYYSEVFLRHCSERDAPTNRERTAYFEQIPTPARHDIHYWLLSRYNELPK